MLIWFDLHCTLNACVSELAGGEANDPIDISIKACTHRTHLTTFRESLPLQDFLVDNGLHVRPEL